MLESHPRLKKFLHYLLIHPYTARPRWWARTFVIPLVIKRGKGSIIRRKARLDIIPSKKITVGVKSIIEDYAISTMEWAMSSSETTLTSLLA